LPREGLQGEGKNKIMTKLVLLLLTIFLATPVSALGSDPLLSTGSTVHFSVLLKGKIVGDHVSTRNENEIRIHFEYSDRGRGPVLDSRIVLGPDGIPVSLQTSGQDYLKAPVEEHFSREAGVTEWKNKAESGTTPLNGPAFYFSLDRSMEELGILAGALARAEGKRLPLLPSGEASVEILGDVEIESDGMRRTVRHYEISGLGFLPVPVWLDETGAFFAFVDSWLSVIPEGWETAVPTLLEVQQIRSIAREQQWAKELAITPVNGLAITGARLFDADSAVIREGMTVLVVGDTIQAVGKDGTIKLPKGVHQIDANGKTLLPGLWDMHTHLSPQDGPLNIAAGVTSIRDMANGIESLMTLKDRFDSGEAIGPRVRMAGILEGPGPFAAPTNVLVSTPGQATEWVQKYAEMGYDQVKIYSSVKPELVKPIALSAHESGLRVSGHIPAGMWAEDAVAGGYDEITHLNMFFLNFYKDVTDTRTPARFTEVAKRGADLDFESGEVRAFINMLKIANVVVDPTVTVFESMFRDRPGQLSSSYAMIADRLPPQVRRTLSGGGLPVPDGMERRYAQSFQRMLDAIKHLYEEGVTLVAGTDALTGFTLHRELELYVEAGIPAPEVLRIATLGSARVMNCEDKLGSIVPGKLADLVLVNGRPDEDIRDIRKVEKVVKNGVIHDSAALYAAVGVDSTN
jgi:hypothetical protein